MHRGGTAVIHDLGRQATLADIDREVKRMKLTRLNAFMTTFVSASMLRSRTYSTSRFGG
jgi:hypothetical protein